MSSTFLPKGNPDSECVSGSSEEDDSNEVEPQNFKGRITEDDMSDLFELCKSKCTVKYLSVLVYMTLRNFGISWRNCDALLRNIGELLKLNFFFLFAQA